MSNGRKADRILQALLTHRTIKEAARAAQMSERQIYTYLADKDFEARYRAARDDIIRGVSNSLMAQMNDAVNVIGCVMRDIEAKPYDRLAAAKMILEFGSKYIESQDIIERIAKLETAHNNS